MTLAMIITHPGDNIVHSAQVQGLADGAVQLEGRSYCTAMPLLLPHSQSCYAVITEQQPSAKLRQLCHRARLESTSESKT